MRRKPMGVKEMKRILVAYRDEPITEQQEAELISLGYCGQRPLTRAKAARLIEELRMHQEETGL